MYEEFVAQMQKDLGKKVQTEFWCRYESTMTDQTHLLIVKNRIK
jgi:hypothetical protein